MSKPCSTCEELGMPICWGGLPSSQGGIGETVTFVRKHNPDQLPHDIAFEQYERAQYILHGTENISPCTCVLVRRVARMIIDQYAKRN